MQLQKIAKNMRVIKLNERHNIIYIKHLGQEPYNEIKFDCGKKVIVSYSLSYWHSVFQDFQRINKNVLINPDKIISKAGIVEVELIDNSKFFYSRRKLRATISYKKTSKYYHNQTIINS